jgi:hypothetical protein
MQRLGPQPHFEKKVYVVSALLLAINFKERKKSQIFAATRGVSTS